jgi:ADP-heptose:LPS heptosyltransferase
LKAFGIVEHCPIDYDLWKPTYLKEIDMIQSERKLIGIQLRGSGVMKTLPRDYIRKLVAELSQKYTVVLLDQSTDKGFSGDNVVDMCGKTTTHQCVALLKQLAMVITMDSGMLWLAHAANCPVLSLLGPTREQERLSLHPQYPEKAKSINLSEMIGCTPCFETCPKCYRRVDCMNLFNHEELTRAIMNKIEQIVGVE